MKQLYSGALVVVTLSLLSSSLSAQNNFNGGTYVTVTSGNWHNTSGSIWEPTEPPQNCNNCIIVLAAPGTVVLNTSVTLTNGSKLVIGASGGSNTTLKINNSGASTFANGFNILLDGTGAASVLSVTDATDLLDATAAGALDGILQTSPGSGGQTEFLKEYGNAPLLFNGTTVENTGDAAHGQTLGGPSNLSSSGTLPIILGSFSAEVSNGSVDLAWTTDLEINSDHFTVQSSSNAGATWNTVGTVAAQGNSSSVKDYAFVDSHPAQGTSEYRLILVDRDGNTAYSDVKAVRIGALAAVSVYPNPASDFVNVTLGGEATINVNIRLVNLAGQVLLEKTVNGAAGTTVPLTVSSYPAGNYLIVITGSDGSKQVNKVFISK